ncbi:MAG: methylmalonyl Co-A mutase-associated GTPase MeaB [Anaerolineae bacterium]
MTDRQHGKPDGRALADRALDGDRRAVARLLTLVENGHPEGQVALARLFPRSGHAHVVGFTGSTGAGKSTLVNRVAQVYRQRDRELAVVAVDPTSPFSGGALLGDRLRMRDLVNDPGVFIRSMASRGHPGGLAHATRDVVTVLDALGVPVILVETVGAGQAQVEVARVAHTVVLVEAPGMGDDVQALKAGLLEIADIIVVNKADRPESRQTLQTLRSARLGASSGASEDEEATAWTVPILETSALEGQGVTELVDAMIAHRDYLKTSRRWEALRARHARAEIDAWVQRHMQALMGEYVDDEEIQEAVEAVVNRERDPASAAWTLVDTLVEHLRGQA